MSGISDTGLAAHMISRICHDLASPLTSVCNGAELLESDNDVLRGQAGQLVETGAAASLAWLEFVRYAFGSVGVQPGDADIGELRSVISKYFSSGRVRVVWDGPERVSYFDARIGLNLALVAVLCLPAGGRVHVEGESDIVATGYSDRIRVPDFVPVGLGGQISSEGLSARTIYPYFLGRMCAERGFSPKVVQSAGSVEVVARRVG